MSAYVEPEPLGDTVIVRAIAAALVRTWHKNPDMKNPEASDVWEDALREAEPIAAALLDGTNPLVVPTSPGMAITLRGLAEINQDIGRDNADARWRADLAPLLALHQPRPLTIAPGMTDDMCAECSDPSTGTYVVYPCPTIDALPERLRGTNDAL